VIPLALADDAWCDRERRLFVENLVAVYQLAVAACAMPGGEE